MDVNNSIAALEGAWGIDGFLGAVREGRYDQAKGEDFLRLLGCIQLPDDAFIPGRLVALLWYLPSFLEWQKPRVEEKGGDLVALVTSGRILERFGSFLAGGTCGWVRKGRRTPLGRSIARANDGGAE